MHRRSTRLPFTVAIALAIVIGLPAPVRAGDALRAQQLFDEALALLDEGRWDEACPKFRASFDEDLAIGTLLNVAKCSDHEGKLVQALSEYERASAINGATADDDRKRAIDERVAAALKELRPRLPWLAVLVSPDVPGTTVTLDAGPLPMRLGDAAPVDPGMHRLRVTAPGHHPIEHQVVMLEGKKEEVRLELVSTRAAPPVPARSTPTEGGLTGTQIGGVTLSAFGGAALITGAIFMGLTAYEQGRVRDACWVGGAPPSENDDGTFSCRPGGDVAAATSASETGRAFEIVSWVGFGAGAAALATGITMIVAGAANDEDDADSAGVSWTPIVGPTEAGMTFRATF